MNSPDDPLSSPAPIDDSIPQLNVAKTRLQDDEESQATSGDTTPATAGSPPRTLASRASTLSGILSRSSSPAGRLARFGRSLVTVGGPLSVPADGNDETRSLIVRAFSPALGVYASAETDELIRNKGFSGGLVDLLQPYGERISGKVVVRDSNGSSRSWEDFGVRFFDLKKYAEQETLAGAQVLDHLEELVEQYLEQHANGHVDDNLQEMSQYYRLLLTRLLFSQPPSRHETFRHPVATVIAIDSSTPNPIETLRQLYNQTAHGNLAIPAYANPEYLRYYLLVHDEDRDDIAQSSTLFDQMKRHFGLHCHLLRIRSSPCQPEEAGSEALPEKEWLAVSQDLAHLRSTAHLDSSMQSLSPPVHESDAIAIRNFVRELVSQSIVPYMEQRISVWNENVASRRRGITGRVTNLSKRFGFGFGGLTGSSKTTSTTPVNAATANSSSGNFDTVQLFYKWDMPEALLRKMADFATMLRDYKLAAATYQLLVSDYTADKAWKYLAGANEMCAITNLLNPLLANNSSTSSASKSLPQLSSFDTYLDTAVQSYLVRSNEPALALRTVLVNAELLKVRGRQSAELAAKWLIRALELNLAPAGCNTAVLLGERVANCLASMTPRSNPANLNGTSPQQSLAAFGSRTRKAALWSMTGAEEWMKLGRPQFAAARLHEAQDLYTEASHARKSHTTKETDTPRTDLTFEHMAEFMSELSLAVRMKNGQARKRGVSGVSATGNLIEPEGASSVEVDEMLPFVVDRRVDMSEEHHHNQQQQQQQQQQRTSESVAVEDENEAETKVETEKDTVLPANRHESQHARTEPVKADTYDPLGVGIVNDEYE